MPIKDFYVKQKKNTKKKRNRKVPLIGLDMTSVRFAHDPVLRNSLYIHIAL